MKRKKICILIIILIVLFSIYYIFVNYKIKYIREISQNINNYKNIHVHTIVESNNLELYYTDRYWNDFEYMETGSDNACAYFNGNNNEFISIDNANKNVYYCENNIPSNEVITDKSKCFLFISLDDKFCKIKYKGIEKINNIDCYKIFVNHKLQENKATIWIEKNTGFVIKFVHDFDDEIKIYNNSYEVNKVDNIKRPDIDQYLNNNEYEIVHKKYIGNGDYEVYYIDDEGNEAMYIE